METFQSLKRRTTDLLQSIPQSLPQPAISTKPTIPTLRGTWEKVELPPLPRSSHTVDVVAGTAYIFGGEFNPRKPVNNDVHVINLPLSLSASADSYPVKASPPQGQNGGASAAKEKGLTEVPLSGEDATPEGELVEQVGSSGPAGASNLGDVPPARVGHASAVIGSRIFVFGGRGGPDMSPLEESGRVWVFDTRTHTWTFLDPAPAAAGAVARFPSSRSYHAAAAVDRPRHFAHARQAKSETWHDWAMGDSAKVGIPQAPIVGNVAATAVDEEDEGYGTFFVHAGCLADGERTNDIWAFNVRSRVWSELPTPPGPARGGTSICVTKGKIFRFGGFDGKEELGGQVDVLHLASDQFNDFISTGEVSVTARGDWETLTPIPQTDSLDPDLWPAPRSVSSLLPVHVHGRDYLLLLMGEGTPSSDGHNAAGNFLADAWVYNIPTPRDGSIKHTVFNAIGRKSTAREGRWTQITAEPYDDDVTDELPSARGWISASVVDELEEPAVFLWGGVGDGNVRLGDGWILRLG
ncbi:hypothetical protein jhhlp_006138 [Lomentospora prolificans]|uniref:Uncharacterized protein n=1 Tax=Lomentospora prolificans TaxID=41688 RepID=A0A2N3N543_9PEZI|nr:hypothetical protein jhhlp_006138 [Lomentospora prolificans]